jgi:hypothetical protein
VLGAARDWRQLITEARRVLKEDGVLIVSTPDKQAHSNDGNRRVPGHKRELYVSEFREMLEKHFARVELYRVGTVAGGVVLGSEGESADPEVESTRFVLTEPSFGKALPGADVVLAVCGGAELPNVERPYLLLDRDRRLVHECEDGREDVGLLKDEIRQMQETEVQAFKDALNVRNGELAYLRLRLEHAEAELDRSQEESKRARAELKRSEAEMKRSEAALKHSEARAKRLEDRVRLVEGSLGWRSLEFLRGLRPGARSQAKPGRG